MRKWSIKTKVACLIITVAPFVLYTLFAHSLVEAIYFERLSPKLNSLLSGRDQHSLEFYLNEADVFVLSTGLRLLSILAISYFLVGKQWVRRFGYLVFNIIIIIGLLESLFLYSLLNANFAKQMGIYAPLFHLHSNFGWQIPQFEPKCSRYDSELGYTLKPGGCTLSSYEFVGRIQANKKGLPDDDASMIKPELIVLGDSFSMGWGVNPNETYASQLEAITKMRVLNTGISSFGTAREVKLFKQLDASELKYLIIQYYINDHLENRAFFENGALKTMSQTEYDRHVEDYLNNKDYWFGRYSFEGLKLIEKTIVQSILGIESEISNSRKDDVAMLFLNVLEKANLKEQGKFKILVFDVSHNSNFYDLLKKALKTNPAWEHLHLIDVQSALKPELYYDYDPHLRPEGHKVLANFIHENILEIENSTRPLER